MASDLTTQYGLDVTPVTAIYDRESGLFVGAECRRHEDGAIRYYRVDQLRHPQGAGGVQNALEAAPTKEEQDHGN